MNSEIIRRLVLSKNSDDIEIAMNLLVGKSKLEIKIMFGLNHSHSHTLIKGLGIYYRDRRSYRISEDCIIYLGYNMSIASEKHYNHIDLTL